MGASASRVKFRESVSALIEVDVSPDDADFWDELWKVPSSAEDVFELISPEAARRMRDERFDNLSTLFTQATAQLCQIVETPYNIYFDQALNCVRVLTRVLPFLLEKGDLGEADENVEQLCWGSSGGGPRGDDDDDDDHDDSTISETLSRGSATRDDRYAGDATTAGGDATTYAGDATTYAGDATTTAGETLRTDADDTPREEDEDEDDKSDEDEDKSDEDEDDEEQEPLALLVVHAAMHMLFLPQFTCDYYEENEDEHNKLDDEDGMSPSEIAKKRRGEERTAKEDREARAEAGLMTSKLVDAGISLKPRPTSIVWAPGLGVTARQLSSDGLTRRYDKNRVEVLRLLLASCCDPLFSPADEYNPLASRWLSVAVAADAPNAVCLFYSLFNTVLSYDPAGHLPYANAFAGEAHVALVELSAQVLCVLLDSGLPGTPESASSDENGEPVVEFEEASKAGFNIFRSLLARIDSGRELHFIHQGLARLLKNVYKSKSTYLPNSVSKLACFQELLVLLWKMLEENPMFMNHVLTQCDVTEIVVPICFLMYQSRRDPAKIGLVHICTFVLLKLSGERSFGVTLNKPFDTKLPCDLPLFTGNHSDLVCITLHKLIVNGAYKLVPLYSCFLTIVCNVSPYWRSMSLVAAVKLVNLFELFSSPKFLYSGEHSHRHLALLLEVFNNVIQYQYTGNQHLVYAVVRRKDSFGRIASLTLARARAQCRRAYGDHDMVQYDADAEDRRRETTTSSRSEDDDSYDDRRTEDELSRGRGGSSTIGDEDGGTTAHDEDDDSGTATGERFAPTEEWLTTLRNSLPLETVTRLLQHVVPVVDELCARKNGVLDETDILEVLKDITMVGLLPVPHAIVIRKYQPNQYTALWFTAFLWGVVFLRNQNPPIFDGRAVELFQVSMDSNSEGDEEE